MWHFESFVILVGKLEGEVEECLGMEGEEKRLGNRAAFLDIVAIRSSVVESESDCGCISHSVNYFVVGLGAEEDQESGQQQVKAELTWVCH